MLRSYLGPRFLSPGGSSLSDTITQFQDLLHLCEETLHVWTDPSQRKNQLKKLQDLIAELPGNDKTIQVIQASASALKTAPSREGVIAIDTAATRKLEVLMGKPLSLQVDAVSPQAATFPLSVVLDNLRSAHNVGSIFRSADALGIQHLYLCGYTPTPDHPAVKKASMGAAQWVSWSHHDHSDSLLRELQSQGQKALALETGPRAEWIQSCEVEFPSVLVLGNERFGISGGVLELCHRQLALPMYGKKNSLNVANAFTTAGFYLRQQYQAQMDRVPK